MKFRISKKDLILFCIFAVLLLYLCGFITTNLHSLGVSGKFYGLNPIPGFTDYLGATMTLFVIFLIVIFTGVSSFVFEKKKGFGLEIGEKQEKGYNRWAKEKEVMNDKGVEVVNPLDQETTAAGIPLINDGKKLWVDNGEYHNLVVGSTGSGKSQTIVEPMVELLIKKGESMIITDPKGELYKAASQYMRERGYNVVVLNFREPQHGNAWNPLILPYKYYKEGNYDKAIELLDDVAINILYDPNNKSGDPFWEKSAADYFSGLALGLFQDADESEINLNSINLMSTHGEEKFGSGTYAKEYFQLKGEDSNAYIFASNTINAPAETKGGILSVFRQKIRLFSTRENLSEMLSYSDFDMRDIGREKTAVFVIIHDEKTTYHSLATIFLKQCYETLIDVAQENGGKLPFRTNFILDEFANMPPLKDITTMVTAARSRAIRFTFIIQNFAQLKSVYGNEDAETIKGNCGNLVYLISTELAALEEISKMCGEVKSKEKDKTASTPLVTVTDLQKLKLFEAIIIRWRLSPFKTKYTPNFKMDWGHSKVEASYPNRETHPIHKFDLKEFTKKKKGEMIKNNLTNQSSNPLGGFGDSNPFRGSFDNPFASTPHSNPFMPKEEKEPVGGLGGGIDLDALMKDIDKKIADLDAEEERQKKEQDKLKEDLKTPKVDLPKSKDDKLDDVKVSDNEPLNSFKLFDDEEKPNFSKPVFDSIKTTDSEIEEKDDLIKPIPLDEEPVYRDVPKVSDAVVEEPKKVELPKEEPKRVEVPKEEPKKEEQKVEKPTINQFNIFDETVKVNNEPKVVKYSSNNMVKEEVPNIAVATSSPMDGFDVYDNSRTPQKTSIIEPTYNSDDIKKVNEVKNKETEEVEMLDDDMTSNFNIFNAKEVPKKEEKANVNIDVDKVKIDSNNPISDDEFFDDFFGDDE